MYIHCKLFEVEKLSWYAGLNCNLLENFALDVKCCVAKSYAQRLFHWKTYQSAKTVKLFHCERFAIYGTPALCVYSNIA